MAEPEKKKRSFKPNKDNIGWRYCLTMMLLCFLLGLVCQSLWFQYQDSRYVRVWEADKMQTLDRCSRLTKLALTVMTTGRPGSPALEAWFQTQTAEEKVPPELRQDNEDWQVLSATNAVLAQMEHFDLEDRMSEGDPFQEELNQLGELIDELYADTGRPIHTN